MDINTIEPKIYVACLAAYNNGILHGAWVNVEYYDQVQDEINKILESSPIPNAEEWAIHDYEDFGGYEVREYDDIEHLCELSELLQEHGEIVGALLSHFCGNIDECKEAIENNYAGHYDSEQDFAQELFDEIYLHEVPESIRYYIDYEAFCRDLFIGDYFSLHVRGESGVHVFSAQ